MSPAELYHKPVVEEPAMVQYRVMVVELDAYADTLRDANKPLSARIARHSARIAHGAWLAEADDPIPSDVPWCGCDDCQEYLHRG